MDVINAFPAVGPYMGVTVDKRVTHKTPKGPRTFRVLVYGAFNAYGLIGPEKNGIAVLDEDERAVLADDLSRESSGYFGPSKAQFTYAVELLGMSWEDFKNVINASGRNRYVI